LRGDLQLDLDFPLPSSLAVGSGTAVFVCGWCFCPRARTSSLAFVVDGQVQPATAHGMPRGDVLEALESDSSDAYLSFRSGFWGIARIAPRESEGETELLLRASLDDGSEAVAELGRVRRMPMAQPLDAEQPEPAAGPFVAICMATHEPPMHLFRRQVESIRAQTHRNWVCVVSDDCSSPESFAAVGEALAGDPRFVVSRSPRRLGFYSNFERALSLAPPGADFFAMADQDDNWHPDKLETLIAEIGDAKLVYSDARIVTVDGDLVADTYWDTRRNNSSDLTSLLVANSVTGAASLFRREVLDHALPFPPAQFGHFHDHWVALTALALGDIAFVERPLYDYVQHGGAVLGHAEANRMPALADRVRGVRRPLRDRVGLWRFSYFVDVCRLMQYATILMMRCGDRMTSAKRRSLDRFLRADRSPLALGRLALRAARELVGRPETLGAELGLCFALVWHRIVVSAAPAVSRRRRRLRIDARPPERLVQRPGRRGVDAPAIRQVGEKVAPLELAPSDDAPHRINLLIPAIDLDHFFGGYIAKLNLARRLQERGARVRVVTTDPVGPLPPDWRDRLESYSGLAGVFDRVELAFGRESAGLEVSRSDRFIATTWWTAHIARDALASLRDGAPFLYLIQEYEPFTFPMGSLSALASESYRFPHSALFSTELLRDYFRRHQLGVYSQGAERGDAASAAFENAISAVAPPTAAELTGRSTRRLLLYARPEAHASRNMFELGVLGLSRAAEEGVFQQGWELNGIGTVDGRRRIGLGAGASLELLPRRDQTAYVDVLRAHDVGLALMHTPHPSLAPIEMASAGLLTVTNSFENKTAEAMASISSNLVTVEPTLEGVTAGLREAVAGVEDVDRRVSGSHVAWSRDWGTSFDDELMARVESFLEA
jgi:glycosyltransferase involved in cell wall biosynthesis